MVVLAALLGPHGVARADGAPAMWQGYANAWIASHVQRVGGEAPKDKRLDCQGDVNGDGHADVVVIYLVVSKGGGDDWTQYATVLTSTPQGFGAVMPKEVGGKGKRTIERCTIAASIVELGTKDHVPGDASCCPSKPGTLRLRFENGALADAPTPAASGR